MDPIATMEALVNGQERTLARIYGTIEIAREKGGIVGCSNMAQNPELAQVAPHHGDFEVDGFRIQRRQVDQVDNFYVWRI